MAFRKTAAASVRDIGTFSSEQAYELKIAWKKRIKKAEDEGKGVEVWKCMTQTRGLKSEIENLKSDAAK